MITSQEHRAIVIVETDELQEMAYSAVQDLGKQLRNKRSVEALVKRFAKKIASDPSSLRVEILDIVGYCDPRKDQPGVIEPIVIHEGKPLHPHRMTGWRQGVIALSCIAIADCHRLLLQQGSGGRLFSTARG